MLRKPCGRIASLVGRGTILSSPAKFPLRPLGTTTKEKEDPTTTNTSDPPILTWVETTLPNYLIPYAQLARIDKPIGTMLLLWPCFWGVAVASPTIPDISTLALFGTGAFVMRGAGCTINDLWDRDLDRSVARTRSRPLASGVVSVESAVAFLAVQLSMGLGVLLSLPHTLYCFQWGCASLPLVLIYPATKRFFPYPQLVLGLTINWGAIMGWAAVHGSIDPAIVVPLYGSGVTWTLLYDTLYAHQDKEDDKKLGLQSTALTFGDGKAVLYALAATTSLQWGIVGYQAELAVVPYGLGVVAATSHLVWQIKTADLDNPHNLAERFRSNSTVGGLMFGALAAGNYFASFQ